MRRMPPCGYARLAEAGGKNFGGRSAEMRYGGERGSSSATATTIDLCCSLLLSLRRRCFVVDICASGGLRERRWTLVSAFHPHPGSQDWQSATAPPRPHHYLPHCTGIDWRQAMRFTIIDIFAGLSDLIFLIISFPVDGLPFRAFEYQVSADPSHTPPPRARKMRKGSRLESNARVGHVNYAKIKI